MNNAFMGFIYRAFWYVIEAFKNAEGILFELFSALADPRLPHRAP
jgi:hypothetical protein